MCSGFVPSVRLNFGYYSFCSDIQERKWILYFTLMRSFPPSKQERKKKSSPSTQKMASLLFFFPPSLYRLPSAPPSSGSPRESCNRLSEEIRSMDQSGRGLRVSLVAAGRLDGSDVTQASKVIPYLSGREEEVASALERT